MQLHIIWVLNYTRQSTYVFKVHSTDELNEMEE